MMPRTVAPFPESSPARLQSHKSACPGPHAGPRDFVHPLGASPAYLSSGPAAAAHAGIVSGGLGVRRP